MMDKEGMDMSKKIKKPTITQQLTAEAKEYFSKYKNDVTRKAYIRNFKRYIKYCRECHNVKTLCECYRYMQEYADYLVSVRQFTPATVHTYLAPVCAYFDTNMACVTKPLRHTADYKRGRSNNGRAERSDNDFSNPKFKRLVEFALNTGLRRAEIKRLTAADFCYDESAAFCVLVQKGKGGKRHAQRVVNEAFVKSYFENKDPTEKLFTPEEMNNKLNIHKLRALCAQNAYRYYEKQIAEKGDSFRETMEKELRARWQNCNIDKRTGKPKRFDERQIQGFYFLRGKNKEYAIENNLPLKYDKLILLYISVFFLSHWRLNVSAENYLNVQI